jgi:hypothetical protein
MNFPRAIFKHEVDLLLASVLAIFSFYFGSNVFSPVRFDQEKIEVWAADGQIQVRGLYHYRNRFPLPVSFSLGLPFPVDDAHKTPSIFSISEVSADGLTSEVIAPRSYHGDVVFRLCFAPRQEKWIRVDYVQDALQPSGRYILLTTRKWNRPLDRGEYILHLTDGSELAASNYALQAVSASQSRQFSFTRSNFLPGEDWNFSWRTKPPLIASRHTSK